jgi:hypothetical protein
VWQWKFREGVDRVLKEVEKCSQALTAVEKKRKQLSFLKAVEPLVALLDSGSQQGRGGDVASLQADLLGVWDLWNQLRTAVLARAEGPGLSMLLVYDMRCGAHKVDLGHFECPERLDLAKTALNNLAQRHPQAYTLQPTLPPSCPYYPLYDPAFHTYRTEVSATPRLAQGPSPCASHPTPTASSRLRGEPRGCIDTSRCCVCTASTIWSVCGSCARGWTLIASRH